MVLRLWKFLGTCILRLLQLSSRQRQMLPSTQCKTWRVCLEACPQLLFPCLHMGAGPSYHFTMNTQSAQGLRAGLQSCSDFTASTYQNLLWNVSQLSCAAHSVFHECSVKLVQKSCQVVADFLCLCLPGILNCRTSLEQSLTTFYNCFPFSHRCDGFFFLLLFHKM